MKTLRSFKLFIQVIILTPLLAIADNKTTLIIGYGDHDAAPYAIEKGEKLHAGVIKDIASELADELDIDISFLKTPRKRIERYLENNIVHIVLNTNPVWLNNSEKLQWSDPLFIEQDKIIVKSSNTKEYKSLLDFKNMIIGTIRGYKYPNLEPYFSKGYFTRYDVSTLEVNLIRLKLNRIDALVDADILINYQLKQNKSPEDYKLLPLVISEHNISSALSSILMIWRRMTSECSSACS